MKHAPVVLTVYNRPEHTLLTLESLIANDLFEQSPIYVFCDGPKNNDDLLAVLSVREIIHSLRRPNMTIIERERNLGLAPSIVTAANQVCENHDRFILLEDDLLLSPHFLDFMNRALDIYAPHDNIMHVCGYALPTPQSLPETFFLRPAVGCSWGWGTWKRAWTKLEIDAGRLAKRLRAKNAAWEFNVRGSTNFVLRLKLLARIPGMPRDSWTNQWYASIFLNNGLCLRTSKSLVKNIGNDGSGVHSWNTNAFDVELASDRVGYFEQDLTENPVALEAAINVYRLLRMNQQAN